MPFVKGAPRLPHLDNSPNCAKVLDLQGKIMYINPAGLQLMGFDSMSQCLDVPWMSLWGDEEKHEVHAALAQARAGGTGVFQAYCTTARGVSKWWDVVVTPMLDTAGKVTHLLAISRDITERKRLDEALHFLAQTSHILASSLDYETTLKEVTACVVPTLADLCFFDLLLPDMQLQRVSWTPTSASHKEHFPRFFQTPPQMSETYNPIVRVLSTGQPDFIPIVDDAWMVRAAYSPEYLQFLRNLQLQSQMILPLTSHGRTIGAFTCCMTALSGRYYTSHDFTLATELAGQAALAVDNASLYRAAQEELRVRKQMEEEQTSLLAREHVALAELDHFFSLSLDLLCVLNLDGTFKKINPAFERILGYTPEELMAHPLFFWLHPDDIESTLQEMQRLEQGESTFWFQNRYRTKNGSYRWVGWTASFAREEGAIFGVGHDITHLKEEEQHKDAFISMAAHELKTPVTVMKATLQLIESRIKKLLLPSEVLLPQGNAIVQDMSARMSRALYQTTVQTRLINDLLDASRIQSDKLRMTLEPCDLLQIVRDVVENQRLVTPQREIVLDLPGEAPINVMADVDRIGQVVSNYLNNALKYSPEAQPVIVGLSIADPYVRVWVRDNGPGLSPEAQQHVWERFYQVQDYGASNVGLGLGLHICRTLIARHCGEIGVNSVAGQGSTFWFMLPLSRSSGP